MKKLWIVFGCVFLYESATGMEKPPVADFEAEEETKPSSGTTDTRKRAFADASAFSTFNPTRVIPLTDLKKQFLKVFALVPENIQQKVADYAEFKYGNNLERELKALEQDEIRRMLFKWSAVATYFGVVPYYSAEQDYWYSLEPSTKRHLFRAKRLKYGIPAYHRAENEYQRAKSVQKSKAAEVNTIENFLVEQEKAGGSLKTIKGMYDAAHKELESAIAEVQSTADVKNKVLQEMVKQYKIHLMPVGEATPVIIKLLEGLQKDAGLQALISTFKVRPTPNLLKRGMIYGRVVIYVAPGKDNAQEALNKLYALFKDVPGSNSKPRYNGRVTDLIWIAQGDGDYKGDAYGSYYEPGRVYYSPTITGLIEDYHLAHPETGKAIV